MGDESADAFLAKANARNSVRKKSTAQLSSCSSYLEGWTNHDAFTEDYFRDQARKREQKQAVSQTTPPKLKA